MLYYESTRCNNCGNDLHVSLEEGHGWDVDNTSVCYACASIEGVKRMDQNAHRDDKPKKPGYPVYMDGRIYVASEFIE